MITTNPEWTHSTPETMVTGERFPKFEVSTLSPEEPIQVGQAEGNNRGREEQETPGKQRTRRPTQRERVNEPRGHDEN